MNINNRYKEKKRLIKKEGNFCRVWDRSGVIEKRKKCNNDMWSMNNVLR